MFLCLGSCEFELSEQSKDQRRETLEALAEGVIMPMHRDFEQAAAQLDDAAISFCASPSAEGLAATQQAWGAARGPWKQLEVLNFGPFVEEPLRFGPKIDFWPAREETIEATLSSAQGLTPETLEQMGSASRGLPVIEYLLYDTRGGDLLANFADDDPSRCAYLTAATGDVSARASDLREAWDPDAGDYLGELTRAGRGSAAFMSLEVAVGEVANRMGFICENIRRDKINRPLGSMSGGTPQPEVIESRFSDRSLEDILDNLKAVEALFYGRYGGRDVMGWHDHLKQRGVDMERAFEQHIGAARAAVAGIDGPLREAIATNPESVKAILEPLRQLQRLIQTDMIAGLGVSVTFNDNDGD